MAERKEVISFCCDPAMRKEIDIMKGEERTRGSVIRKLLKIALSKQKGEEGRNG